MPAAGDRPAGTESIWVLEDPRLPESGANAVAERLGQEFRRISLSWSAGGWIARFARHGSLRRLQSVLPIAADPPVLTLSSGRRAAAVAAWLKRACGSRMVHFGPVSAQAGLIDLHVRDTDARDADLRESGAAAGATAKLLAVLGTPHRFSPLAVHAARGQWAERLAYLPRPRVAVLLGHGPFSGELPPLETARLGHALGDAMRAVKGALMITAGPRTGSRATEGFAQNLGDCQHLLHRAGEPGPDPELGFLAHADAVLAVGHVGSRLLHACALTAPVYVAPLTPLSPTEQLLQTRLIQAGQIRQIEGTLAPWPRKILDEAGRVAEAVRGLMP